jgi:hypothetical protein
VFFTYYIIVILLSIIIFPHNIIPNSGIYLFFSYILIAFYLYKENFYLKKQILYVSILLTLILIISFNVYNLFQILLLLPSLLLVYSIDNCDINKKEKRIITLFLYISLISVLVQINFYKIDTLHGVRKTLSLLDPNFSGILIFFIFLLSKVLGNRFGIIISLYCGILLQSRLFILIILTFYLIKFSKKKIKIYRFILNPYIVFILGNILIVIFSFFWVANFYPEIQYATGLERANLNDESNYGRFLANLFWVDYLIKFKPLYGIANFEDFAKDLGIFEPHNSFLYTILSSGLIFSFFYYITILNLIKRMFTYKNYEYIASYFIASFFLHGLFSSYFLILFITVFKLNLMFNQKQTCKI